MSKKIALVVGLVVVAGGLAFYGGMKYGQNKSLAAAAQRQARFGQMGGANSNRTGRVGAGGGFVNGEIVSVSDQSLTVKINNDGSKVVFFTSTTPILKSVTGTSQDLKAGEQVMITGATNPDGSISAQNIQIRPASSTFPGGAK